MKKSSKWALGALIAAVAGYVAGILTAPKSGKETREDIKDFTQQGMAEAEKQLKKLHTQVSDLIKQAKERADQLKGTAAKDMQFAIDAALKAKEKARDLLSALHEGNADDKELQRAIKDANKAIEHLQAFLKR